MTPNRSAPTRCTVRGCVFVGHFTAHDGLCPEHRTDQRDIGSADLPIVLDLQEDGRGY